MEKKARSLLSPGTTVTTEFCQQHGVPDMPEQACTPLEQPALSTAGGERRR